MLSNSRVVHINSRDRVSGTNEQFMYSFNMGSNEVYTHCCVLQASVPVSYYMIQNGFNTFQLKEGISTVSIAIPPGNYNTSSFRTILIGLLNQNSPTLFTYNVVMNNSFSSTNNGLFYYSVTGNAGVQPQFIFTDNMYEQFGFPINSTISFVGDAAVSQSVVNFIPEQTLYIYSDLVQTKNNNSSGVLQELYAMNAEPYSCITYQCQEIAGCTKVLNNAKTNSFSIILKNEDGQTIDLNGRNMNFSILLYKPDDVYEMAKNFMKYITFNIDSQK